MNRFLFSNIIFPLMEISAGTTIKKDMDFLKKSQWWSKEEIQKYQIKKLRLLIDHSYRNIPYYHRIFKENHICPEDIKKNDDLKKIPLLTKDIIRSNPSDFICKNNPSSSVMSARSSGSTGKPFEYYINKGAYSRGWAQTFRCWGWAGFCLGDPYIKMSINSRNTVYKQIQDFLMNTRYICSSHISKSDVIDEIEIIKKFRPGLIRGYASHMFAMAKMMEDMDISYSGSAVATTGDMLFPDYRKVIEKQFDCKVFDAYGGEGTPVSYECEAHCGYHIADEDVIVEFLKNEEDVSDGETGRIVFTNLNNYQMPFIRYEINDLGRPYFEKCACGRNLSMMHQIEGRDSDVVVTPSGDLFFLQFFSSLLKYFNGIEEYQVVQEKKDNLKIKIIKNAVFSDDSLNMLKKKLFEHIGDEMKISIDFVEKIPVYGDSGKKRLVISKVPVNF